MAEKTLPEQARFLAKFVEENEYDEWPWADYEIAQMLEDLAAEIERLQSELGIANKDYAGMSRTYVETRNERDAAAKKADAYVAANSLIVEECHSLRAERDELIKAIKLHLSHHEAGCVYLDEAVEKLEGRIND